ncbi:hypothetical protein [Paenibacillus terrigena]|uniref:hypothetical protein n=1 Tax=Paenibacillus terrigena TaxID=369333 RepID=UPI0028D114DE|nr:hypothetical protein [Paenibacillus terrigena]
MRKTKLLTWIVVVLILSPIFVVLPASETSATSNTVRMEVPSQQEIVPSDSQLISPVRHRGRGAYQGLFTTTAQHGKNMIVKVQNKGKDTVYMTIKRNDSEFVSDIAIRGGSQRVQHFEEQVAIGIRGDWKIYVYSRIGAALDLRIEANQY